MTKKFTTPCFIRKNTPELRKKLADLGYIILFSARNGYGNVLCACGNSVMSADAPLNAIDCGTNEQLFLAIAALREDSDYMQWFVNEYNGSSTWFQVKIEDREVEKYGPGLPINAHKATPKELIERFKDK